MAIYRIDQNELVAVPVTDFASQDIRERQDLQRLLKAQIKVLDPNLMVLSEEFSGWDDSLRRLDLLCLDKQANLVVVELKRTQQGGHGELQALRYAAMVSAMTFDDAVVSHARLRGTTGTMEDARAAILRFLEWADPSEGPFAEKVGLILASADFSKELTTTVLWLNDQGLDIRCVRLKPYRLDNGPLLLDVEQIIPLPEASDFQTRLRTKERSERVQRTISAEEALLRASEPLRNLWEEIRGYAMTLEGVSEQQTQVYVAFQKGANRFLSGRVFPGGRPQVKLWMKVNPDSVELEDGFIRDVRDIGHWGVGSLEVIVSDQATLDRAKALILRCHQEN